MSEWKGPWKCNRCGRIWFPKPRGAIACAYECNGDLKSFDRRAPDPDLLVLLREAGEALERVAFWHSAQEQNRCLLLARIAAKIKEMEEKP